MKLIHFAYTGFGGLSTFVQSIIDGDKHKVYNHIIIFYGDKPIDDVNLNYCIDNDVEYYVVRKLKKIDIAGYRKIFKLLKRLKPESIILNQSSVFLPVYLYSFNRSINIKKIINVDHTPIAAKSVYEKMNSLLCYLFFLKTAFFYKKHPVESIGPLAKYLTSKNNFIEKGVNIDLFKPKVPKDCNHTITICMIGRLDVTKDHHTLIRALSLLKSKSYFGSIKLALAGNGTELEPLKKLSQELGISNSVNFVGLLSRVEVLSFLQQASIYVHATLGETICYSIMEAQSVGLPIVGSNVKGVNVVINDSNGLLYEAKNEDSLAMTIDKLVTNSELRSRLSKISRDYAVERLSDARMFLEYHTLINKQ